MTAPASLSPLLDVGPVRVSGAAKANRGRVIYLDDGRLLVVAAANNVKALKIQAEPAFADGVWTAHTVEGRHLEWTRKGCPSCGWTLGRLKLAKLVDVAEGRARRA